MFDDMTPIAVDHITDGDTVYDVGGAKVGTVDEVDAQAGYMAVKKGWLFTKEFYVPLDTIFSIDADGIYLRVEKDDLRQDRFAAPPVGGSATATIPRPYTSTAWDRGPDTAQQDRQQQVPPSTDRPAMDQQRRQEDNVPPSKDAV